MNFIIVGEISDQQSIAVENNIRELPRLRKVYGKARWKKMKGFGKIRFENGQEYTAEIHWYEAHGIGKKEYKIKRIVD